MKGNIPISVKELGGFGNIASFWTMEQLDRFCKTLGISYTLMQERPGIQGIFDVAQFP